MRRVSLRRVPLPFRQRRVQVLLSLAVFILALAVVAGSGASFTSTSANPNNVFTAGNLHHVNTNDGAAILTAAHMKPGDVVSGTVGIQNDGDVDGTFTLSTSNVSDTPGFNGGVFSSVLMLTVVDQTTGTTVYTGHIDALPANSAAGTIAAGDTHTYQFTVTFPDTGRPPSATTGDNAYKQSSMSIEFDWEAITV